MDKWASVKETIEAEARVPVKDDPVHIKTIEEMAAA